jgi:hypothetical protein
MRLQQLFVAIGGQLIGGFENLRVRIIFFRMAAEQGGADQNERAEDALHGGDSNEVSAWAQAAAFAFAPRRVHFPRYILRSCMASVNDFPARGKIIKTQDHIVVFAPTNTNYELHLTDKSGLDGIPAGMIEALLRVSGRKIWTVKSGGNFIEPIFGPPRKIQGRIRYLDDQQMVVQAGTPIIVALPSDPAAYDMSHGMLTVGDLVNVSLLPGGTFECLGNAVAK